MKCEGVTYFSNGADEGYRWEFTAECNAGPSGDCGFSEVIDDGTTTVGITSDQTAEIHARHIAHADAKESPR